MDDHLKNHLELLRTRYIEIRRLLGQQSNLIAHLALDHEVLSTAHHGALLQLNETLCNTAAEIQVELEANGIYWPTGGEIKLIEEA